MRLWHKDLIPVLPRQQLLGQWRECCLIAKNIKEKGTPNHLLVNRIMDYPINHFFWYSNEIMVEMHRRGYKVDWMKFSQQIDAICPVVLHRNIFEGWHNDRYLWQCFMNLQEKFDCEGIGICEWEKVLEFMSLRFDEEET